MSKIIFNIGEKIEVSDDGKKWFIRHFSHFEREIIRTRENEWSTGTWVFARRICPFKFGDDVIVTETYNTLPPMNYLGKFIAYVPELTTPYLVLTRGVIKPCFNCKLAPEEKTYELLKDTPVVKAGAIYKFSEKTGEYYPTTESSPSACQFFKPMYVEDNPEWFKLI